MRLRTVVFVAVPILVLLVLGLILQNTSKRSADARTAEPVAAALRSQVSACGASLEVEFQQVPPTADCSPGRSHSVRLVRTPDVVRIHRERMVVRELQGQVLEKHRVVSDTSYDRRSGEERIYARGGGKQYAETGSWASQCLSAQNPDPLLYPVDGVPLVDAIDSGTVSAETETVDGHDCQRVEIDDPRTEGRTYVVWVDPAIGFNPRRIDIVDEPDKRLRTTTFSDYREVCEGAWFPYAHKDTALPDTRKDMVTGNTVSRVSVGRTYKAEELIVSFPKDARVCVR